MTAFSFLATQTLLAAEQQAGASSLVLPAILMVGLLYMFIVPQRKQKQKAAELLAKLREGAEVVTASGVYGKINHLEDDLVHLEVDTDVVIRVSKSSVVRILADDNAESPEPTSATKPPKKGLLGMGQKAKLDPKAADGTTGE